MEFPTKPTAVPGYTRTQTISIKMHHHCTNVTMCDHTHLCIYRSTNIIAPSPFRHHAFNVAALGHYPTSPTLPYTSSPSSPSSINLYMYDNRHTLHLIQEPNSKWKFIWDMASIQNCIQIDAEKLCRGKIISSYFKFLFIGISSRNIFVVASRLRFHIGTCWNI